MENTNSRNNLWNKAGKAGLALGLISIAYMMISQLLASGAATTGKAFLISLLSLILWTAKFVGCIWLFRFCMKKYADAGTQVTNSDTFKFGMVVALLSALVYSAYYFAYVSFIAPDTIESTMSMVSEQYSAMMTDEAMDALESINIERVSFFFNLIYCFLFGTVLSAIFSRNIPSRNPFANWQDDSHDSVDNQ